MQIVQTIICSVLFYALYRLILEGRIAHSAARAYLLLSVVLSIAIPALELPILPAEYIDVSLFALSDEFTEQATYTAVTESVTVRTFDRLLILKAIYWSVVALLAIRFILVVAKICLLRKGSNLSRYRGVTIAASDKIREPFSFWTTIFINKSERREQVLLHEYSHIVRHHTLERVLFELMRIAMWFNPFIHLIVRSAIQVEEWQADCDVLKEGYDIHEYRQIIFHQLFGYSPDITCGLNNSLTKKRFIMMTNFNRGKHSLLRLSAAIPIVVAMILTFGTTQVNAEPIATTTTEPAEPKNTIEIRKADKAIYLNNEPVTLEQLPARIKQSEDRIVTIDAEQGVTMDIVTDIKQALRSIEGVRINYLQKEELTPQSATDKQSHSSNAPQNKKIKARNLLQVKVTSDGTILLRNKVCSRSEVKQEVKRFVRNYHIYAMNANRLHIGNLYRDDYSDFSTTALTLPDGRKVCCPTSNGIVSLSCDQSASFDAVRQTISTIEQAYKELRQSLSHRVYGKAYDKLESPYKEMVDNAIPIKVFMAEI